MINLKTGNYQAVITAVVVGTAFLVIQKNFSDYYKNREPAENWFEVKSVSVPDFIEGQDPMIIYDNTVRKPFYATWSVEVHRVGDKDDHTYCTGSGTDYYEPTEKLPATGVNLSWYMGKVCFPPLTPGQYVLQTHWEIRPDGYPTKHEKNISNIFQILPNGAQFYVTPSQAKKLNEAQQ